MAKFDELWDYSDPAGTEEKFRALLAEYEKDPAILAELLTQIARTQGLQKRFEEGHATLDRADKLLTGEMTTPRTRSLLERGRLFNSGGDKKHARGFFQSAFEHAKKTGEDAYAVDAAHMLAIVAETGEESLRWNHLAIELAEKSADPRAKRWLASLYNNTGWTHHDAGRFEEALDLFGRAVKLREAQGQAKEARVARWCVGRCLRSLKRVEEALAVQQVLLSEHEKAGGRDGYVFEEMGECHLALGRSGEAKAFFAKAYGEFKDEADFDAKRLARIKELGGLP